MDTFVNIIYRIIVLNNFEHPATLVRIHKSTIIILTEGDVRNKTFREGEKKATLSDGCEFSHLKTNGVFQTSRENIAGKKK